LSGSLGPFGSRVKAGATSYHTTGAASAAVQALAFASSGSGPVDCVYLEVAGASGKVQAGDIRLTSCQGQAPGTRVAATDGDAGRAGASSLLHGSYADGNADGLLDTGDFLYLHTGTGGALAAHGSTTYTLRATAAGGKAAGTFVEGSDNDWVAFGGFATALEPSWAYLDSDGSFGLASSEQAFLLPAQAPGLAASQPLPVGAVRLGSPFGALVAAGPDGGAMVEAPSPPATPTSVSASASSSAPSSQPASASPAQPTSSRSTESTAAPLAGIGDLFGRLPGWATPALAAGAAAALVGLLQLGFAGAKMRARRVRPRPSARPPKSVSVASSTEPSLGGEAIEPLGATEAGDGAWEEVAAERVDAPARAPARTRRAAPARASRRPVASKPAKRYVNVDLADRDRHLVDRQAPLEAGQTYYVRVDVNLCADGLASDPRRAAYRGDLLPRPEAGHGLQVVVASASFKVDTVPYRYFVPAAGPGHTCSCGEGDACREAGEPHLFIPVQAPRRAGQHRLRVVVYYRNNVVQSQRVTAHVGAAPRRGAAIRGEVDFNLTKAFTDLGAVEPRSVSILTNDNQDGTHTVLFTGASQTTLRFQLDPGRLEVAMKAARSLLLQRHVRGDPGDPATWEANPAGGNARTKDELLEDLRALAKPGYVLLSALFGDQPDAWARLEPDLLGPGTTIQVARTRTSTLLFPWALVYDTPIEDAAKAVPCRFVEEWETTWRGKALPPACPHAVGSDGKPAPHKEGVLCPYAFWGVRHILDLSPSRAQGAAPTVVPGTAPPRLAVAYSKQLKTPEVHLGKLAGMTPPFQVATLTGVQAVLDQALAPGMDVLYFYCHGGMTADALPTPFLQIGDADQLSPTTLFRWKTRGATGLWKAGGPLVVINGCRTTALLPKDIVNFVDAFVQAGVAGVIGTEIPVMQVLADEAGLEILRRLQGDSVCAAVKGMRLALLSKGNLLGLAYTPHCSSTLRLEARP
jgi:hypothetical protein